MQTTLSFSVTLALLLHSTATLADASTMTAISQIPDGQPPAPASTWPSGSTSQFWSSLPGATVPSYPSSSYENPFTIYTTQTNSLGVITGMPSVVTSQPAVVTSQPASPTLPSYSEHAYENSTTSSTASPTTLATSTVVASPSHGENATASASATFQQSTGGAVANKVAGAGIGLIVLGLGFSML